MGAVLTRQLRLGDYGDDVRAVRRACLAFNGEPASELTTEEQSTFGYGMQQLVKRAQRRAGIDQTGVVGPNLMAALRRADAFDAYGTMLLERVADAKKPKLVEPSQGFDALDASLWKAFSLGRSSPYNFSDLGVYNPSAYNKRINSDHAVYPSFAFDLGIDPDTGWNNLKARAYVLQVVGWREVEYVILGDRIHYGRFSRRFRGGGHLNHIHVSGCR